MVQKIGAQYIGKKLYDTLMAPPPQPAQVQVEDEQGEPVQVDASAMPAQDLTGQTITDERGAAIGRAQRLGDVAVYVIVEPGDDPDAELARCVAEPGMRLLFQMDGDRIAGLIYAPDPERVREARRPSRAVRADDV